MAGVKRGWMKPLAAVVLLFGAVMHARAQSVPSGSLIGKLTDLHSAPLAGATVVLRNQATGTEMRTTTTRKGDFQFTALDPGTDPTSSGSALRITSVTTQGGDVLVTWATALGR